MAYKEPSFKPTRSQMINIIKENITPMTRKEVVSLGDSVGRTSVYDILAKHSLPNMPVSGCDGISVRFEDFKNGIPDTSNWKENVDYKFSNTGVALSSEFDTVIAIEDVKFDENGSIEISSCPKKHGEMVGKVGGNLIKDEVLVYEGEKITLGHIGILASAGITVVTVYAKPVVTFIPTGDELVSTGMELPLGKNIESNSKMLEVYIKEWGGIPILYPIIPDDINQIKNAVKNALAESDIVLICAGSAKGNKDFTLDVLEQMGDIVVRELGHGPGKHGSLTMVGEKPIIGLPGPARGAELIAGFYVKGAIAFMNHQEYPLPEIVDAILVDEIKGAWIDFVSSVYVYRENGKLYAKPVKTRGKTWIEGFRMSNGSYYCTKRTDVSAGTIIPIELSVPSYYIK